MKIKLLTTEINTFVYKLHNSLFLYLRALLFFQLTMIVFGNFEKNGINIFQRSLSTYKTLFVSLSNLLLVRITKLIILILLLLLTSLTVQAGVEQRAKTKLLTIKVNTFRYKFRT